MGTHSTVIETFFLCSNPGLHYNEAGPHIDLIVFQNVLPPP